MNSLKNTYIGLALVLLTLLLVACGPYSFTGSEVGKAKTFKVNFFQNNAPIIEPGIDRTFTQTLRNLIQNQTNLMLTDGEADLLYEGEITKYSIAPMSATANQRAAQNRLTISVNVRFVNKTKEEDDFEKKFSFYYDYPAEKQLVGSEKDAAVAFIYERITQDIFNASLVNW